MDPFLQCRAMRLQDHSALVLKVKDLQSQLLNLAQERGAILEQLRTADAISSGQVGTSA